MFLLVLSLSLIIEKVILISIILGGSLGVAMYSTWAERKVAAVMQDRRGPNRAGPFGLFQPLADGLKLFMKEEIIPNFSNKFLFILGPSLAMLMACMTSAVIPWGPDITKTDGGVISLQVADISIGVLYIFGVVSLGVYGIMLGAWASNNKFSLLSGLRAASQAISYELAMGISLIALVMMTGSLSMREIVAQQHGFWHDGYFTWNFFKQPLAFIIFIVCSFAELNRAPFDLAECESELIGGYHTEFSSMKLGFYLFAEYINMFITSVILSTLFFGGYNYPGMDWVALHVGPVLFSIIGVLVLLGKAIGFILFFMFIRWTIPRFRYDQLMNLGWKSLIPLALINMLITGAVILYFLK
ncbi:MAG: NADH-quinone oxidoreductase subunit NuoH [Bacteroidetes bacterium]|mgnify:FL=1|jgi:NADH-quinone oxidoreductase subunit H|nr:NADH-quinone oxidoreductase subunit NuoH [Bacteroidota bacterium]MBK8329192.1 NADH-quinone oxidoreductase subunit NuoH [Bacteroidota bacterium]MBK9300879.1 NADH-quinone oxidoreductase subunit NuoH [Bacteroidota bacterium]MBK9480571.1 NADH-quinone oxidoreductase subunit NuoH [Bacteroidota bacterium]